MHGGELPAGAVAKAQARGAEGKMRFKVRPKKVLYLGFSVAAGLECFFWVSSSRGADVSTACVKSDVSALHSMKYTDGLAGELNIISFKKNCSDKVCTIIAILDRKSVISLFKLDPTKGFQICRDKKYIKSENIKLGCADSYNLSYQYVRLNDKPGSESTIVFETVQASPSSGRVCSSPDSNDGPALASFVSTYEVTPQITVYVYELDNYPTIKQAIDAKPRYTSQTIGR